METGRQLINWSTPKSASGKTLHFSARTERSGLPIFWKKLAKDPSLSSFFDSFHSSRMVKTSSSKLIHFLPSGKTNGIASSGFLVGDGLIAFWSNWPSKKQKDASNGLAFPHRVQVKIINEARALKLILTAYSQ